MTLEEVAVTLGDYAKAARNARLAGFDGVELHAATVYLLPQFLNSSLNLRKDRYGGKPENRARIVDEFKGMLSSLSSLSGVEVTARSVQRYKVASITQI